MKIALAVLKLLHEGTWTDRTTDMLNLMYIGPCIIVIVEE